MRMRAFAVTSVSHLRQAWAAVLPRSATAGIAALLGVGVFLRLAGYLHNRSIWLDEAFVALNVIRRSPLQLFEPLDFDQTQPVGFLLLTKLVSDPFGYTEYALRLVPLFAGIVSLLLGWLVARACLTPTAVPIAVGLLAMSPTLIYVAYETKPNSSDVAVALLVTLVTLHALRERLAPRALAMLGLVGAAVVWISNPSVFVLAGVAASLFLLAWREHPARGRFLAGAAVVTAVVVAFVTVHRQLLSQQHYTQELWWAAWFMPLPPTSFADLQWYPRAFFAMFEDPAGLQLAGLAALAFLVGCAAILGDRPAPGLLLLMPVLAALAASALRLFPFNGRPISFLVPALLFLVAEGVDRIRRTTAPTVPMIGPVLVGLLFLHPALAAAQLLVAPSGREELRPVVQYLKAHKREGDTLYVYYGAQYAFRYYAAQQGLPDGGEVIGVAARDDWKQYVTDLARLRGRERVWVLFSHNYTRRGIDERRFFLYHLDQMGRQLDAFQHPGASVHLYDLRGADRPTDGARPGAGERIPDRSPQWRGW